MRQHGTILVVEDDPMLRIDAALMFEGAGFDVSEFESADDALAFVWDRANEIEAIFTDVQMLGDTSGLEFAAIVTSSWPHIAVLVTSGWLDDRPDDLPSKVRFFPKPWVESQILSAVRQATVLH